MEENEKSYYKKLINILKDFFIIFIYFLKELAISWSELSKAVKKITTTTTTKTKK